MRMRTFIVFAASAMAMAQDDGGHFVLPVQQSSVQRHAHTPAPREPPLNGGLVSKELSTGRFFGGLIASGEVGFTAKFADGAPQDTGRIFSCTHKCAREENCPPVERRAELTHRLVSAMNPPPLVKSWLEMITEELRARPEQLPQICIGATDAVGKLYLGSTHNGGGGVFPNLPLARKARLHEIISNLPKRAGAPPSAEGDILSIEWRVREGGEGGEAG